MEVILEDISGKFDLVLEGHATLEQMILEHRSETRQGKQEVLALIKTAHDTLDEKNEASSTDLNAKIDGATDKLSAEIQSVGEKVDGHEQRITHLERKAA